MTTIKIPDELASEIDRLAGPKKRSAYAVQILWTDIQRSRQREALHSSRGAWKKEDHPDLPSGSAIYVEKLRSEPEERLENALRRNS